jgi:GTP cyclohydrolase I
MKTRVRSLALVPREGPRPEPSNLRQLVARLLRELGEEPSRPGLRRTPQRVERALRFLTSGYEKDPASVLRPVATDVAYDEMVIVKDIEFFSLCEHHLLPFFGACHVGYIPRRKVVGLSKLPRLVNLYARRLQVQERLTSQIAGAIQEMLEPKGVGVIVAARHFCMMMRGVEKKHSETVTSAMRGLFRENAQTRQEFLALVRGERMR